MNIDLYKVLGLTHDCTKDDIETKYKELVNIYHPDNVQARHNKMVKLSIQKYNNGIMPENVRMELNLRLVKKLEDATKTFNLINTAYEKLTKERDAYNYEYKKYQDVIDSTEKLRESSRSFIEAQPTVATDNVYIKRQKVWEELNEKHGFDENAMKQPAMNKQEFTQKLSDLRFSRTKQEGDIRPEKLFDEQRFDSATFNALFEKMHKKSDKEMELVKQPSAFNYPDGEVYSNFDNEDLYVNHDDNINFSAADFSQNNIKITPKDLEGLDTSKYTTREKKITKEDIDRAKAEYTSFSDQVQSWDRKDYSKETDNKITPELECNEEFKTLEFADSDTYQHFIKYTNQPSRTNINDATQSAGLYTQQFQPILTNQISTAERSLEDIIKQRSRQDIQFNQSTR